MFKNYASKLQSMETPSISMQQLDDDFDVEIFGRNNYTSVSTNPNEPTLDDPSEPNQNRNPTFTNQLEVPHTRRPIKEDFLSRSNMLLIIMSVVVISFCSIMIFWYVTDYSIRSDPFHEFSDNDIIVEEGKNNSLVFFARSEINLGDNRINSVQSNQHSRIFNKLFCDKAKRTIAYYCLNDFYTCPLGHLPEATFNMLNVVHDNTAQKFNFDWNKNVIYAKIIKIDNLHLANNGSIIHADLIFLYRYDRKAFRIGDKKNPTNYIIDEDTLKTNLNEMLSYCDWFTFTANSIIDASNMNITHLIETTTTSSTTTLSTPSTTYLTNLTASNTDSSNLTTTTIGTKK